LKKAFSSQQSPVVVEGRLSENEAKEEFYESFELHHSLYGGFVVTFSEFVEFYSDLSSFIESDVYF